MKLQAYQDTAGLLHVVPLPDLVLLRQRFPRPRIENVSDAVMMALDGADLASKLQPGARIALAVGSRGIADIAPIVRATVAALRRYGAEPFIIPAMGSHGGATAEGQHEVLSSLGVTEEYSGAPIISSLDVDQLGTLSNGLPIYIDRAAHEADGIIAIGRIKPHTDFNAPIESGLAKMLAIGLGKHAGALTLHSWGIEGLTRHIPEVAKFTAAHAAILCGLAIIENAYDEVAEIVALAPEHIGEQPERLLLQRAKNMMPRLPWDTLDVLVIDEMGKDISGAGMDPNITGRLRFSDQQKATAAQITNVSVHDLTGASHGNAIGVGFANFITERLLNKIDMQSLYINSLTAGVIATDSSKIPCVLSTDREAVAAAIRTCGRPDFTQVRLARIESTLRLEYILASTTSLEHIRAGSDVEVVSEPMPFPIKPDGVLVPFAEVIMRYA